MECSFIREHLFDIAEKRLTPELEAQVEAHLGTCSGCKDTVTFFLNLENNVQKMRKTEPDPFISTRTMTILESRFPAEDKAGRLRTRMILQPALLAFFIGLAIFAGILSGRYGYMQHEKATEVSDTEALKSELVIEELAPEEAGLLLLQ